MGVGVGVRVGVGVGVGFAVAVGVGLDVGEGNVFLNKVTRTVPTNALDDEVLTLGIPATPNPA